MSTSYMIQNRSSETPDLVVKWRRLHPDAVKPTKNYDDDAAFDIYSVEDLELQPGSHRNVGIGIAVEVGAGWSYDIRGRSGLNKKGIIAALGLCDAMYQGELRVVLSNLSGEPYIISKGDRVGQLKFNRVYKSEWVEVDEFEHRSGTRGANGWGSSGR